MTTLAAPTLEDRGEPDRSMRRGVVEGCLFACMVGLGESYVTANGIALGATSTQLAMLIAIPLLGGGLGPAAVLLALRRGFPRRGLCSLCVALQALTLAVMALANLAQALSVPSLIALFTLYQVCGQGSGTSWSSWYGDLVPALRRPSYFAHRSRLIHLATFAAMLAGGGILQALEPGRSGAGFALAFGAAAACRATGAWLLWRSFEPPFGSLARAHTLGVFFRTERGRAAAVLVLGSLAFQAATYYSSPFFAPYMLKELGLSYAEYTAALATLTASKFVTMPWWGRMVDRHGPRVTYGLGVLLAALSPLPWQWVDSVRGVLLAQAFSGFGWGGYEVALFTLMLHCSRRSARPHLFAAHTFGNALGQATGSLVGGDRLSVEPYLHVFALGSVLRLTVAAFMIALLAGRPGLFRRRLALLWRMIGYRPGVGFVHRPIEAPTREGEKRAPPRGE